MRPGKPFTPAEQAKVMDMVLDQMRKTAAGLKAFGSPHAAGAAIHVAEVEAMRSHLPAPAKPCAKARPARKR